MKLKNYKIAVAVLMLSLIFVGQFAHAAFVTCGGRNADGSMQPACEISDLIYLVIRVINYLFGFAGLVAMGFIVWAGYGMVTAGGNEEKIAGSKTALSHAIIGFFLVLLAFLLIDAIVALLGGFSLKELFDIAKQVPFSPAK